MGRRKKYWSVLAAAFVFAPLAAASAATLSLKQVATGGDVANPIHAAAPPGDPNRLFILDLTTGAIKIYNRGADTVAAAPFFNGPGLSGLEGEQGAYALAFAPDYATSGKFYVSFADAAGLHVVEYKASAGDPNLADPAYANPIITIPHADDGAPQHYGGWIGFGPDGMLYITSGDSNVDPTSPPEALSQQKTNLLGAVLRIDVTADDFADPAANYAIPGDNPFTGGPESADDPVWAYGLRNPFRAGFDPVTGAFLIGDVGEDRIEEINLGVAGANYGWPGFEGSEVFTPVPPDPYLPLDPATVEFAVYEYLHGAGPFDGLSVTAGEFYQGPVDALDGLYFFGDLSTFGDGAAKIWSFVFDAATKSVSDLMAWDIVTDAGVLDNLVSFAKDGSGNLYVMDHQGGVWLVVGAEIPLPAAAPLFAAGLAGLAFARRRRRGPVRFFPAK